MRNGLAEWVISRAAGPERAATIVGDLLEAQLDPVSFWLAVFRTTVSIARHQPPQRLLMSLFWYGYQLGFYAFLAWWFTALEHRRSLGLFPVVLVLVAAAWLAGWLLWARKRNSSVVISTAWCMWLLTHDGMPTWLVLTLFLPAIPYGWWMQWRRRQKSAPPENDRPAIG
ncbi:MAG: hypothetical protein ABSG84_17135 [Acidobacteriaceae bacterium]|jgi:hypothetical protein